MKYTVRVRPHGTPAGQYQAEHTINVPDNFKPQDHTRAIEQGIGALQETYKGQYKAAHVDVEIIPEGQQSAY